MFQGNPKLMWEEVWSIEKWSLVAIKIDKLFIVYKRKSLYIPVKIFKYKRLLKLFCLP